MQLNRAKWIILAFAICFAFLQALQPFIHAHLDEENHPHSEGLHIAETHESAHALEHSGNHSISDASHAAHIISVSQGIKQDKDAALEDVFPLVLIALWFALVIIVTPRHFLHSTSNPTQSLTRRLPAPRAPPYF